MLTGEFNLEEYEEVLYSEGLEEGIEKGKKEGQDYVLELIAQGLSYEEIKKEIRGNIKERTLIIF